MKQRNYVWIVEAKWDQTCTWQPTCGIAFTRDAGREELAGWKVVNPSDKFRLTNYVPAKRQNRTRRAKKGTTRCY